MKDIKLRSFLNEGVIEAGCDEAGRGPLAGPVFAAAVILPPDFYHPLLNDSKQMTDKAREILRPIIEAEAVAWAVEAVSAAEIDRINILNASIAGMQRAVMRLSVRPERLLIDGNRFRPFSYIRNLAKTDPAPEFFDTVPTIEDGSFEDGKEGSICVCKESDNIGDFEKCGGIVESDLYDRNRNGNLGEREGVDSSCENYGIDDECVGVIDWEAVVSEYDRIPYTCIVKGDGKFAAIAAASVLAKTHRDEYMRRIARDYPAYGWDRNMGYPTREHIEAIRLHGLTPHHRLSYKLKALEQPSAE